MNIHQVLNTIIKPIRKKRLRRFLSVIQPQAHECILDIGGTAYNWELIGYTNKVVLLNLPSQCSGKTETATHFVSVIGDGTDLHYRNGAYDICFSNSVIEHVGDLSKQQLFAREFRRVGKRLWLQTPARSFFFEPHYLTPFIHWLPPTYQKKLLRNFSLWGWLTRPSQAYIDAFVDQTRLLTHKELSTLFPDCVILKERFLFMTKSYLIVRK